MDLIQEVRDGREGNCLWAKGVICSTKPVIYVPIMITCIKRCALGIHDLVAFSGNPRGQCYHYCHFMDEETEREVGGRS